MSLLIKNGTVINEGITFKGSLLIENELIVRIYSESEKLPSADKVIEAKGMIVIPGVIDDQVHFREPGNTHKGDISSESAAAVLGGVTSYMDMPNNNPSATTLSSIEAKNCIAEKNSYANYSFYLGATNDNIEEILNANPSETCGLKVFMGSSTGNMLVDDSQALNDIFAKTKLLIATHCEYEPIIKENLAKAILKYGEDKIPFSAHPVIRSREACIESTKRAIGLAIKYNARLHVLHISTAEEIELIKEAKKQHPGITGEVCVHYMLFDSLDYEKYGSKIKCNPSIKEVGDREAIIKAVKDGVIRVVATDHAPHTIEEKSGNYMKSPSGLPLVQHSLQIMWNLHKEGKFTAEEVVDRMCHSPALNFKVANRGFLRNGYYADIVVLNPDKTDSHSTQTPAYKCAWSPLSDIELKSTIVHTFVNGEQVVENGKLTGIKAGKKLKFEYGK
ncbi:MAG: dihydroorotase [Bacteroidetes bacterium HGW-Bacteroidetes-7]|jgi:dihydroorotase|nr:MAG: dihydroorotase [Bacteroidetes bacterium HGW-Bacteroidetes-7]